MMKLLKNEIRSFLYIFFIQTNILFFNNEKILYLFFYIILNNPKKFL